MNQKPIRINPWDCYVMMPLRDAMLAVRIFWGKTKLWVKVNILGYWYCEECKKVHPAHVLGFDWSDGEGPICCSVCVNRIIKFAADVGRAFKDVERFTPVYRGKPIRKTWEILRHVQKMLDEAERRDTP